METTKAPRSGKFDFKGKRHEISQIEDAMHGVRAKIHSIRTRDVILKCLKLRLTELREEVLSETLKWCAE